MENLILADNKARKGKKSQKCIERFDLDRSGNLLSLLESLKNKTYRTSKYTTFIIREPKERLIYRLPYFPDRVAHHAIMNIMRSYFLSAFTADTYSCIENRGIHLASYNLKKALKGKKETKYCLKLDIKKFYPSIDHDVLKLLLRKKFKDKELLWLLDEIIDSAPGVPIGNYLSQFFANFYLTYFDHWIKEDRRVKYYFRYADDIVILAGYKKYLHELFAEIREYLKNNLRLEINRSHRIFPVEKAGIDFVGYVHYHDHVLLRKGIKKNFARVLKRNPDSQSIASYSGWLKHCNSKNLTKKLLGEKI